MKTLSKQVLLVLLVFLFTGITAVGQPNPDTIRSFKNTIKINISNPMLFGDRYNVLGYERVLKNNQSISVGMGRFSLPSFGFVNYDSLSVNKNYTEKGYTFIAEYRFYLKKENKYAAPRGIYIGPYYSFNFLERTNNWSMKTGTATDMMETNLRLNANLVGGQMGYQFVIKNRLSIDLIFMGPGVWFYSVKSKIDSNLDPAEEELVFEKLNEMLAAKLPGHEITIKPGEHQKSGSYRTTSAGLRYVIELGFRF